MSVQTRSQKLAQAAFARIATHGNPNHEFVSFGESVAFGEVGKVYCGRKPDLPGHSYGQSHI